MRQSLLVLVLEQVSGVETESLPLRNQCSQSPSPPWLCSGTPDGLATRVGKKQHDPERCKTTTERHTYIGKLIEDGGKKNTMAETVDRGDTCMKLVGYLLLSIPNIRGNHTASQANFIPAKGRATYVRA